MKPKLKPQYLQAEHSGQRERWLISYTDLVTILLILFAAVAAQGVRSGQKSPPQQTGPQPPGPRSSQAAKPAHPMPARQDTQASEAAAPQPHDAAQPHDPALRDAEKKLQALGLDSHLEKRGLVISLPQAVLFPSGEDRIMPGALPMVSQIAGVLASVPNKVALVGHADSVPIHNKRFQNNWELSAARSVKLLELLTLQYGIPQSRLSVQSDGSNAPRDTNDTAAGRAENRRVEILLLDESSQ